MSRCAPYEQTKVGSVSGLRAKTLYPPALRYVKGITMETQLTKAYVRLAEEAKKIKESGAAVAIRGEAPKQEKKKKPKIQPPEQLQLF